MSVALENAQFWHGSSRPAVHGLSPGSVLEGTYRIEGPIAEGGCGEVYLARHTRLPARYAVKLLHRTLIHDDAALARFRQEAEITASLVHPHIVKVFDFNVTDAGVPYLVMELIEGQLLSERVAFGAAMDPRRVAHIIDQLAKALHHAHSRGIVHRDLKPDNVMVLVGDGLDDFVKVLDFGISQASRQFSAPDNEGISGTPPFMAPEQAQGLRDQIDHRSDQFSLAAIAYTLLTGREPFRGEGLGELLRQVVAVDPPAPSTLSPAVGPGIDEVVMRALEKAPADRYPNVLAFASALQTAIEEDQAYRSLTDAVDDPPPPRAMAVLADSVEPRWDEVVTQEHSQPLPLGRETRRLLRRVRSDMTASLVCLAVVVALAASVAFIWHSPTAQAQARATWHRASNQARGVIARLAADAHVKRWLAR